MLKTIITGLSSLLLCAGVGGCFVDTTSGSEPAPVGPTGTLTTGWTLDGSNDVNVCGDYQVDRVNVVLIDEAGYVIADEEPTCEAFELSYELSTGWYSSEVTLLDLDGYAVSDTVVVADVRVVRDTEAFVDVDFSDLAIH